MPVLPNPFSALTVALTRAQLFWRRFAGLPKKTLFILLLGLAMIIAGLASLVARMTVLDRTAFTPVRLAVVGPFSGDEAHYGQAIQRGVMVLAQQINAKGGLNGRPLEVITADDGNSAEGARRAARDLMHRQPTAVIGHFSGEAAQAAAEVYQDLGVPAVLLAPWPHGQGPEQTWLARTTVEDDYELRFLANYVRNVIGEKTVSIITDGSAANERLATAFDETLQRFGTRVVFRWKFDGASSLMGGEIDAIAREISDRKLGGTLLVLGGTRASAQVLATLRQHNIRNRVVGPRQMASSAFVSALRTAWAGEASVASILNGTMAVAPMLFDTAGERAQAFQASYFDAWNEKPDWPSAFAYDGARLLLEALGRPKIPDLSPEILRQMIRDGLKEQEARNRTFDSLTGPLQLDRKGQAAAPPYIGLYDGNDLIAALTQLSPIREEGVTNYLQEIVEGRALYVNDRFMYKTNVVYTGVKLHTVLALDTSSKIAELEFTLWFRWRGNFEPQDVVFTNAVEPIRLDKPDKQGQDGDMLYRAYRIKSRFFLNYSGAARAYGSHLVGLTFRHRNLSRNNLMYVNDVLGMGLGEIRAAMLAGASEREEENGGGLMAGLRRVLKELAGQNETIDPMVESLRRGNVLAPLNGWLIERAWISQDTALQASEGHLQFVGFGRPKPAFSQMDMGLILKPDGVAARDIIPSESFVFLAIFALVGAVLASLLDRKDRGQFWRIQTLGLRILSWPLLLVAAGNLVLDYGIQNLSTATVDSMVLVYSALWWLVPTRLLTISIERFFWVPLETRTGRKVPNVIRMFVAVIVYLLASFGVIAVVLDKPITSLLATTGTLTFIIGLALQSNIANVFSGIILNVERAFGLGDYVKINNASGQIIDISWRTIRIRADDGQIICLPNGKATDAEIHNYSKASSFWTGLALYVDAGHDPERIVARIAAAVPDNPHILTTPDVDPPYAVFAGIECVGGHWVARYNVGFAVKTRPLRRKAIQDLWLRLWLQFREDGVVWPAIEGDGNPPYPALEMKSGV